MQAAGQGALEVKVASSGRGCRRCLRRDQRLRPVGEKASEPQLRTGGGQGLRSSSTGDQPHLSEGRAPAHSIGGKLQPGEWGDCSA